MLHLNSSTVYYWYNGAVNMRSSFDALCGLVNQYGQATILQGGVYIFVNKKRNQIKLLSWEGDGLAIYYKRLEKGVYGLPSIAANCCASTIGAATHSIHQALAPERCFERSNVDPSLVAQIIVEKFVDHLPLDRQIKRFARLGYPISDSTIGNWVAASAAYLKPLYEAHKQLVLASGYLHADETIIKVLDSDKKNATHRGYYWVYQCNANQLVLFDYRTGRGREGPQSILKDYKGYLQTDGYIVYEDFDTNADIIVFNCMAHARRKHYPSSKH